MENKSIKMPKRNGVTRPREGTITGKIWEIADSISESKRSPASGQEVMEAALEKGFRKTTVATQYSQWKRFYGVKGRILSPKQIEAKEQAAKAKAKRLEMQEQAIKEAKEKSEAMAAKLSGEY